ncbi:hypothetical protein Hypma_006943 [Hypsizygus marmoreus]|uniref:Uncharacterized protein n=1 Tax=Hypsizygus marmoreus TaxID=39966 RepID=A0A369JWI1_HYPMA|nr:hypothetical protein Hypma_006943 [Hypsizygus marmoreus]
MSPNMSCVYTPPLGTDRQMRLRSDGRFADDDHLVGPQPYSSSLCHYAAIPRKPRDPFDPLAIMWWVPTKQDFDFAPANIITGLGTLDPIHLGRMGGLVYSIKQEVEKYRKDTKFPHAKKTSVISLVTALDHAFARLASLPTSFRQMQFGVALLQRCFLEIKAYLDYVYIFHPRMTGEEPPATCVADTIGAYAFEDVVIQEFVRAGLPVWIVKPYSYLPTVRIDSVVAPLLPIAWAVSEDVDPPYPPFFTGSATSAGKYNAFHSWARSVVGYPNPFASLREEATPLSSSSATPAAPSSGPVCNPNVSSGSQVGHVGGKKNRGKHPQQPYPKSKPQPQGVAPVLVRNKFTEISSPFCPPPILTWSEALARVDRDRHHLKFAVHPSDAGYVFPDPGLVLGVSDIQKLPKYIHTWLKYRQALLFRMSSQGASAAPVSSQLWRTLLNYGRDALDGLEGTGKFQQRRQQVVEILGNCLGDTDLHLGSSTMSMTSWRGHQLPSSELPSQRIIHEVIWELFELNFRFEFVGLDSRACSEGGDNLEVRQHLIMACFPGRHGGSLLVADVEAGDRGLAAVSWKDRAPYLLAMLRVVKSWSGCPPLLAGAASKHVEELSEKDVQVVEEAVTKFYSQSFFNYFARAAIVPHRLPRVINN